MNFSNLLGSLAAARAEVQDANGARSTTAAGRRADVLDRGSRFDGALREAMMPRRDQRPEQYQSRRTVRGPVAPAADPRAVMLPARTGSTSPLRSSATTVGRGATGSAGFGPAGTASGSRIGVQTSRRPTETSRGGGVEDGSARSVAQTSADPATAASGRAGVARTSARDDAMAGAYDATGSAHRSSKEPAGMPAGNEASWPSGVAGGDGPFGDATTDGSAPAAEEAALAGGNPADSDLAGTDVVGTTRSGIAHVVTGQTGDAEAGSGMSTTELAQDGQPLAGQSGEGQAHAAWASGVQGSAGRAGGHDAMGQQDAERLAAVRAAGGHGQDGQSSGAGAGLDVRGSDAVAATDPKGALSTGGTGRAGGASGAAGPGGAGNDGNTVGEDAQGASSAPFGQSFGSGARTGAGGTDPDAGDHPGAGTPGNPGTPVSGATPGAPATTSAMAAGTSGAGAIDLSELTATSNATTSTTSTDTTTQDPAAHDGQAAQPASALAASPLRAQPAPGDAAPLPVVTVNAPQAPSAAAATTSAQAAAGTGSTAPSTAQLVAQLGGSLARIRELSPGEHIMTVRVTPESFGPVRVVAHLGAEGVRIELHGASAAAQEALKSAMSDLRRDLAATGLKAELQLGSDATKDQRGELSGQRREDATDGGGRHSSHDPSRASTDAHAPQARRAAADDQGGARDRSAAGTATSSDGEGTDALDMIA